MTTLFFVFMFFTGITIGLKFFSVEEEIPPQKEKCPIVYPYETPISNFDSIINELENSSKFTDFKAIYVRIIIFKSCYPEEDLMHEILEGYYKNITAAI